MQKKIFLIDDDTDDRMFLYEALKALDVQVICESESNGYLAIKRMRQDATGLPDIIFLDINLPGKSGWDYLNMLKADTLLNDIPVVMYSTSSVNEDVEKAINTGAAFLFTKPVEFEDLKNCLAIILQHLEEGALDTITKSGCPWFHLTSPN